MNFLNEIIQNLRLLISKYLKIDFKYLIKNIYKNEETPSKVSIDCIVKSTGVLHIGAHRGSERYVYDWLGKEVVWIEANPKIYKELKKNLTEFKFQRSYQTLLHAKNDEIVDFFLSSNDSASSSIFDFSEDFKSNKLFFQNKKRNIFMKDKIKLKSETLDNFVLKKNINLKKFNHWVIDVQGAELYVLQGSKNSLNFCESLTVEISTENFYEKGSSFEEVKKFLIDQKFRITKDPQRNHEDVVFVRESTKL